MFKRITIFFFTAVLCLLQAASCMGQPPVNDEASGAIMLTLGSGCTAIYSNITATQSPNEPLASCSDDPANPIYTGQHLVWFKFIAPTSGAVRVSNNNTDYTFDSQIALFSAGDSSNYSTFQIIACDDDCNCGTHNFASLFYAAGLTCGQTYYVLVDGWTPDDFGTFCITVDEINGSMLGTANSCSTAYPGTWGGAGNWPINPIYKGWMSLLDNQCRIVVNVRDTSGCYANSFTCKQNVNQGGVRQLPDGTHYLDRNYLVNSTALTANVQLQFFYLNTEFNALNTASGNNLSLYNMHVFKQDGSCENNYVTGQQSTELSQTGCANQYMGTTGGVDWVTSNVPGFPSGGSSNFYLVPDVVAPPPPQQRDSICLGDTITIHGDQVCGLIWEVLPGGSPLSSLSCATCANPVATPQQTTTYVELSTAISFCNDTTTVVIIPPANTVHTDTNICFNSSVQLSVPVNDTLQHSIVWSPALYLNNDTIANPVCTPSGDTDITYIVTVTNNSGVSCASIDTISVRHLAHISLSTTDTTVCQGTPVLIPLTGNMAFSYDWTPGIWLNNTAIADPLAAPQGDVVYKVTASYLGCKDSLLYAINIIVPPGITNVTSVNATACGVCDGSITLHGLSPSQQYNVSYVFNGITHSITDTTNSDSALIINGLCQGIYDNITVSLGMCSTVDTTPVVLSAPPIIPAFSYAIHYGCNGDTVVFTNNSQFSTPVSYRWDFGDHAIDTSTNPTHIYTYPDSFHVTLFISNIFCIDSITDTIPLIHPIKAAFTIFGDTLCQGQPVSFTNTSTGISPSYVWAFGDGATDTATNPVHTYYNTGLYHILLTETDFVPCQDTASALVQVDSLSGISMTFNDTTICVGKEITFTGDYSDIGNTGIIWNFGDGYLVKDVNPVQHSYDATGTFTITLSADYRSCRDTSISKNISVYPYPFINIGGDTTMCPGAPPILISNLAPYDTSNSYMWSSGESTNSIAINAPGTYWLQATSDHGCMVADSVTVKPDCYIGIPNVFTPNGDGINDYFLPRELLSKGVTAFSMNIYDRWGEKLFETTSIDGRGWDGKFNGVLQPEGVFIYIIDVTFKDDRKEHLQGNITLLR